MNVHLDLVFIQVINKVIPLSVDTYYRYNYVCISETGNIYLTQNRPMFNDNFSLNLGHTAHVNIGSVDLEYIFNKDNMPQLPAYYIFELYKHIKVLGATSICSKKIDIELLGNTIYEQL